MVKVASSMFRSTKPFVDVEIQGVAEVVRYLKAKGKAIHAGSDAGFVRGANLLQQEVQQSIIGNKSETKSVDTGRFANSIRVEKIKEENYEVVPVGSYPTGERVEKIAALLEFGTEHIYARRHFRNSLARRKEDVVKLVNEGVKRGAEGVSLR